MEEILKSALKEAPLAVTLAVALLLMCKWFLASIKDSVGSFLTALEAMNERFQRIEKESSEARAHSRAVIEANTAAMTKVLEMMREQGRVLDTVAESIKACEVARAVALRMTDKHSPS